MSWYRFFKDEVKGQLKVDRAHVAFYDMERGGSCFDESFIVHKGDDVETLHRIGEWLTYVETDEVDKYDRSRVFIHMDDGSVYELLMKKIDKEQLCELSRFNGGR